MKTFFIVASLVAALVAFAVFSFVCGGLNDAASTAKKEFYPSAMLKKYEWFKDASSQLAKKQADLKVYEMKFDDLKRQYGTDKRSMWSREDREQYNLWQSEMVGIAASYNQLASEYNAQMSKFNYRFTNVGDLPPGTSDVMAREYATYIVH